MDDRFVRSDQVNSKKRRFTSEPHQPEDYGYNTVSSHFLDLKQVSSITKWQRLKRVFRKHFYKTTSEIL